MTSRPASAESIVRAADVLRRGGLVAFPTETVYGLGADATQDAAVKKIFSVKGRPAHNPLIVHVYNHTWVAGMAVPDGRFDKLSRTFWPGPLTLVLSRRPDCPVSPLVSGGQNTLAVRSPDHPVARDILSAVGRPLAAPSANPSGRISPTRAREVEDSLGPLVDLIIDGGPCRVGIESTVLDLTLHVPAILRPGTVTREQIEAAIGPINIGVDDELQPKAPGQLSSHYAPGLRVRLNAVVAIPDEAMLGFGSIPGDLNLSPTSDLDEAAANLFAMLHALDQPERYRGIAVAPIPDHGIGTALNDRLRRAAAPRPK